ncbi:FMN-linked oxidoreductase [Desarmillaria tabescens]|uniref:tRNA-dihydrouridine synthase n=1 Tax=Armillaria tabescens TaxID=1929756 RepID=A0AA39N6C5_ARMTA|nr:FMN-linked oxidoreductase [Desarmillaria tabescens]KAK0458945.1 FMN-linked oxidoreductase [Desarmillaria tabescens]
MVLDLSYITAPMVNQSDLPFRTLSHKYGATLTYTQMLQPEKLVNDKDYLEFHLRDLSQRPKDHQVVVQLCGNDPDVAVDGARKIQDHCDGVDLNLGCPQEAAREGHFGAYLLGQRDWPVVEQIVSSLSHSLAVPVSVKLRLCQPVEKTLALAQRLEADGASWITLHARTVSARRRRNGPADLSQVKALKETLRVPVISNGNVRVFRDIQSNLDFTGADGVMVGETLLGNPCIFSGTIPDPVDISLEYLQLCRDYPDTATFPTIQTHIRHFVDFQCGRKPWYQKFRAALGTCCDVDDVERMLRTKVERWRGKPVRFDNDSDIDEDSLPSGSADNVDLSLHS